MKKILFINSSLTGGGSERVMAVLANKFSNDYDVSMILLRDIRPDTYKVSSNVKLIRFNKKSNKKIVIALDRFIRLRKTIKKINPDYIISFMYDINIMTLISAIGLHKRIIVSERADPKNRKANEIIRPIELLTYRMAYKVVFQTPTVKDMYPNFIKEKSFVIPNPIRADIPKKSLNKDMNIIVSAGRLTEQKNYDLLIDAFSIVVKKHPNYVLKIYGKGALEEHLKNKIRINDLSKNILLAGYSENIDEIINNSFMYVSSSNYEGISNSMLEAMAMSVPTVCTDCPVGGARLIIKNNKNGILVKVNDVEELSMAINKLIEDKKLYNKISTNSQKVLNDYSIDVIYSKWLELL